MGTRHCGLVDRPKRAEVASLARPTAVRGGEVGCVAIHACGAGGAGPRALGAVLAGGAAQSRGTGGPGEARVPCRAPPRAGGRGQARGEAVGPCRAQVRTGTKGQALCGPVAAHGTLGADPSPCQRVPTRGAQGRSGHSGPCGTGVACCAAASAGSRGKARGCTIESCGAAGARPCTRQGVPPRWAQRGRG